MRCRRNVRTLTALFVIAALFVCGCGAPKETEEALETEREQRSVSFQFQGVGEDIEWKESGVVFEDGPVTFQDPVTEQMLRNMIGKPEGEVLRSELQEIHAIHWVLGSYWSNLQYEGKNGGDQGEFAGRQPQSLEDFALCDNLQKLSFGSIEVPSLAPLASLTQLESIYFGGSTVTEERLWELELLPELKQLSFCTGDYMDWSEITDGSFLLPLADRLTYLDAAGKVRWNPEVLAQMTELDCLLLEEGDDLSFLEELTGLEELVLYACTADDWSPLAAQQNLRHLVIGGNQNMAPSVTLEDLSVLVNLEYLGLTFTDITKEHSREEIIDALPALTGFYVM